jgi:RNase P/RNase MRP subunit p30
MQDIVFFDDLKALQKHAEFLDVGNYLIAKKFKSADEIKELKKNKNFEACYLLDSNNQKEISKFQNFADSIAVLGGDVTINKFAASNKHVDFLIRPVIADKLSFDTGIANLLLQNEITVVMPFSQLLNANSFQRTMLFRNYIFTAKICRKFGIDFEIMSCAQSEHELRAPEDLLALQKILEAKK